MFKKLCCLIVILTLLSSDVVYPLTNSSLLQDENFRDFVLEFAYIVNGLKSSEAVSGVRRDDTGVWVDREYWNLRVYERGKASSPKLAKGADLIGELDIDGKLKLQIYFKGISDEVKNAIRSFLIDNPDVGILTKLVLDDLSNEEDSEKLSDFIGRIGREINPDEIVDRVIKNARIKADIKERAILKDYITVFTARMKLREKRDSTIKGKDLFILKKLLLLENNENYRRVVELLEKSIGKRKRLLIVDSDVIARVFTREEGLKENDIDGSTLLSRTWNNTIYFNREKARLSDLIMYVLHEVTHLYNGSEKDARKVDKEIISVLKGAIGLLRGIKTESVEMKNMISLICCTIEYEVLGHEIDFHTARLQLFRFGKQFLEYFRLPEISIVPFDMPYINAVKNRTRIVIKESRDSELSSDIETVVRTAQPRNLGVGLFSAFLKYIKRKLDEKVEEERVKQEEEELLEEEESIQDLEPLYGRTFLSFAMSEEEAKRRCRDVISNAKAPLFARINDAIMLSMYSENEAAEVLVVEDVKSIVNEDPVSALRILEEFRNERSVEIISEYLKSDDPSVRFTAADALFNIAKALVPADLFSREKTLKNLLDYVGKPEEDVKDNDVEAFLRVLIILSIIKRKEAMPVFLDIIENFKAKSIRRIAAVQLGAFGDKSVIPELKQRIWEKGDILSMLFTVFCLSEIPCDESVGIILETLMKTKNNELTKYCLEALESVVKKKRISLNIILPAAKFLIGYIATDSKCPAKVNFIIGRILSIAIQEGKTDLFINAMDKQMFKKWLKLAKEDKSCLVFLGLGLMHDTFMDISELTNIGKGSPFKDLFNLLLQEFIGNWQELIEFMQKRKQDIYLGKKEYTDNIWAEIADKFNKINPSNEAPLGRAWFQRICLAIACRVLLDRWDVGEIEDRDYILELMILRTSFVTNKELPEGAIGATEAIYGDYVVLDDSFFASPINVPVGVDTVWHEATHLLNAMGVADISDISLLGASSHSNIELYLYSKILGLPPISDVVTRLKKKIPVKKILDDYRAKGIPTEYIATLKSVMLGMACRDKAKGPLEAFFMTRKTNPDDVRGHDWEWEDILYRLRKINNEIIDAYTIRGKREVLVHTYEEGDRFSGYAQRLGVETGFYEAANIYVELLVRRRLTPSQAEFMTRVIAKFMTENADLMNPIMEELRGKCKGAPKGEVSKWMNRCIIEEMRKMTIKMTGKVDLWVTYEELDKLVEKGYKDVRDEMIKQNVKEGIAGKVIKSIGARKRIFKIVRPTGRRNYIVKEITHITDDLEEETKPLAIYRFPDSKFNEIYIDFGRGEELYAYLDREEKKIRLADPGDTRIDLRKIAKALNMELVVDNNMQVVLPREEQKETGRPLFEDTEVKLSEELRRRLENNKYTNEAVREFYKAIKDGCIIVNGGRVLSDNDLNKMFLLHEKDELMDIFIRDFEMEEMATRRIVDYGFKVLEYRENVTIGDLERMTMKKDVEDVITGIVDGEYLYEISGQFRNPLAVKKVGLFECFNYAMEGRSRLYEVIKNMSRGEEENGLPEQMANEVTDLIFNVYLSIKGREDKDEFIEKIIELDISNYIKPPTPRHKKIEEFNEKGKLFINTETDFFYTVLDSMGIHRGLEFLEGVMDEVREIDTVLYRILKEGISDFSVGPAEYIPVEIEDAWRNFNLWKKRHDEVTYDTVQRKFLELYDRYVKNAKGSMPRWGWTFLWLGYYEKGKEMYNAACELLKEVILNYDMDINVVVNRLCEKYELTKNERQQLLFCAPIEGFIMLSQIYSRGIPCGLFNLVELEKRLKVNMHAVTRDDIEGEDIFIKDAGDWLYTFRNIPVSAQRAVKQKIRYEVVLKVVERLTKCGLVDKADIIRGILHEVFDLICSARLPTTGERFIDLISIVDIYKILFDYAKTVAGNDMRIKKSHDEENMRISFEKMRESLDLKDKDTMLRKALTGGHDMQFYPNSIDCLHEFYDDLKGDKKTLLIFTHRHIETVGLLCWIKELFKDNPFLNIKIIPQKSIWELNSTRQDIIAVLEKDNELAVLRDLINRNRFTVLDDCASGLSWLKTPKKEMVKKEIKDADILLSVGWDNFISLQGLDRPCYFTFFVDDPLKIELTGRKNNEPIFLKTFGSIPISRIGKYTLNDYLESIGHPAYKALLEYFGGDKVKLHEWIRKEAVKTGTKETFIMTSEKYYKEPVKYFGDCALREADSEARVNAMDILLKNHKRFGIKKDSANFIRLGNLEIQTGVPVDCFYLPSRQAVVLVKGNVKLVIEVLKIEEDAIYVRIGDKAYKIEGPVNLVDLLKVPVLWIGNSELVEFFGPIEIKNQAGKPKISPQVSMKDIPQDAFCQIPQTKPDYIFRIPEVFFKNPISNLFLQLHYAMVLLSSPSMEQRLKGQEEVNRLIKIGDKEIIDIIQAKGLHGALNWLLYEVPFVSADVFSMANFTKEQEKILRVLTGGHFLRPPLVKIPGQGVSNNFHDSIAKDIAGLGVNLVRGHYSVGTGSALFPNGIRQDIKTGDYLLDLFEKLEKGKMFGAVRLVKNGKEIVQIPENAGVLNYLKVIHHLAHIISVRFVKNRGGEPDPLQEFTPIAEDALVIKYMQRLAGGLLDGFTDFKNELGVADTEEKAKNILTQYGFSCPCEKTAIKVREEILLLNNMDEFADYVIDNNLGSFNSIKEFLKILTDYVTASVRDYSAQLPQDQKVIVEKLLTAMEDENVNDLLIIASFFAGYYIPKVDFSEDIRIIMGLLNRKTKVAKAEKRELMDDIESILTGGDSYSKKAVMIVDIIFHKIGIEVRGEERRKIEEDVIDILSGQWLETVERLLDENITKLEVAGIDKERLMREIRKRKSYVIGELKKAKKLKPPESKPKDIDRIDKWSELTGRVEKYKAGRVFIDIDKTIMDAQGYLTTTPWFGESIERKGLEGTINIWRGLERELIERKAIHPMETIIPIVIEELKKKGIEVFLFTARDEQDRERTEEMLRIIGIKGYDDIITSKGGSPEQKRDALVCYYKSKGWFDKKSVPSLYLDDTLANVKTVCRDSRFKQHIKGVWYRAHYQKRYGELKPEDYMDAGNKARDAGKPLEALEWYSHAAYAMSIKDVPEQVYDSIVKLMGQESCMEAAFSRFIGGRLYDYTCALEKEKEDREANRAVTDEKPKEEGKDVIWMKGAPDIKSPGFLEGIKRVIVIGSHPHGDHVKGFLPYAKGDMANLVDTLPPELDELMTGGPITHSLSNYWGRIGEETIVLFDLGWFPEGFTDPLIQTINPRDREIIFVMDPNTAKTLDFKKQIENLGQENVKLQILPYGKPLQTELEPGKILEIENYPSYHLDPKVGSSIYMVRVKDSNTQKVLKSVGYISELGEKFLKNMSKELLGKLSELGFFMVDGTNAFASMGESPPPHEEVHNKVYDYVKDLNNGKYLIAHFNNTSIRMGEEAELVAENLDPDIPIVIIGGKDSIEMLSRAYDAVEGEDYYMLGNRKIYLVNNVAEFHKKARDTGKIPKLEDVLNERIADLKGAGWTDPEISEFTEEWKRQEGCEIKSYKTPEGKVKEMEALMWDLRKTKAVVIAASQFRGDPTRTMDRNFKGFQLLDAIVDKKDVSILIEGRKHVEGREGTVLRVLLDKENKDRKVQCITGVKKVRATIDSQHLSGHIASRTLYKTMRLVAKEAIKRGRVYNTRTFIPVPKKEWFGVISKNKTIDILRKHGHDSLEDVMGVIKRWNEYKDIKNEEMDFAIKVLRKIFENKIFWEKYIGIRDADVLIKDSLSVLERAEWDVKLKGRANIRAFIASTSKFIDFLQGRVQGPQFKMDPRDRSDFFNTASMFAGFETGVSYEIGKTIDIVRRKYKERSKDIKKILNRKYLQDLFSETVSGRIPPNLSKYHDGKDLETYRAELRGLLDKVSKQAKRAKQKPVDLWFNKLKKYIDSQYLRIGLRHAEKTASYGELRKELSMLYSAVIESVYNYLQEDMSKRDLTIIAGCDYAQNKTLFKDILYLGILEGDNADNVYVELFKKRMLGILRSFGITVEFRDWAKFLHRRIIIPGAEDIENIKQRLDQKVERSILIRSGDRIRKDLEILGTRKGFDSHTGPGGLDDIELLRYFFSTELTADERAILDDAEDFLRRYKEEAGFTGGGDKTKFLQFYDEIINNMGFVGARKEFLTEFFKKAWCAYMILIKFMENKAETFSSVKNMSFGDINEVKDIHKGVFGEAAREGRLFTEDMAKVTLDSRVKKSFKIINGVKKREPSLKNRKFVIIIEKQGDPTMLYSEDPFKSVLSHSGKRTNTIYLGLNTLLLAGKDKRHMNALRSLILHDDRDIERGYHMDLGSEVKEGLLKQEDVNEIYRLWYDLITQGRFSAMCDMYFKREQKFEELFLKEIPVDIRIIKGKNLYEFEHGDALGIPDMIGLNLCLFKGDYSLETQIFILRHNTDRIRYDKHKTAVNDAKYLLLLPKEDRERILNELKNYERREKLMPETKEKIREYVGLKFKTYTSQDKANVVYSVGGNPNAKKTLVFIHGVLVNSRDWRHQIAFFENDYRIIAIDLRGHGKSKGLGTNSPNIKNYAEDIEGILRQEEIDNAIIVGHSMGGMVALNIAELYENIPMEKRRIKGVVLISTIAGSPLKSFLSARGFNFKKRLSGLLFSIGEFKGIWNNPFIRWLVKQRLTQQIFIKIAEDVILEKEKHPLYTRKVISSIFKNDTGSTIYAFNAIMTHNVEDKLANLKIPVMWIIGGKDKVIIPQEQEEDAKKIPDYSIVTIKDAVHYAHATYPREVNRAINRFINTGIYRFSEIVSKRIAEKFLVDVSLDELDAKLESVKIRLIPKLGGMEEEKLRLIDEISRIVQACGKETGVKDEIMIKAVMIIASQVIAKDSLTLSPKPIPHDDLEKHYQYVVQSA